MTETLFHTSASTRQREGESGIAWADRTFCPVFPGVHVCGVDHEDNRFFTAWQQPARDDAEARALWLRARAECEVAEEAGDLCVDLNTSEGQVDDFWTSRQMLPRLAEITRLSTQESQR